MNTNNTCIKRLPKHLLKYIVEQNYHTYTSIDHAVWRYIMRRSIAYHSEHAHHSYFDGLTKAGINIDRIPNIEEMNQILSKIGWGAVCVDGFIPPTAFMEFQAYNVLVIASDIRQINHIEYTPAPDIIHEAAGHAPIIADPEYAEYLRLFGAIGCKALASKRDNDLYEAIRMLSILKENPKSSEEEIREAEENVLEIQNNMGEPSEMAKIRNLHWWTVEYGLIGDLSSPKLYGAGLLSSIGESKNCMNSNVKKIPYSIDAANYAFDITTQQPQLFVTNSFSNLTVVLNEFADNMALRRGGVKGIEKAIDSAATATVELSSGIQISGTFTDYICDNQDNVAYVSTTGPTLLCMREQVMIGHGIESHADGFGSPVGRVIDFDMPLEDYTLAGLKEKGIAAGKICELNFTSGVKVLGFLKYIRKNRYGKILLMTFDNCTVSYKNKTLFKPEWGVYDMAVGEEVISVFAGSADKNEYDSDNYISPTNTGRKSIHPEPLLDLYQEVRNIRNATLNFDQLKRIFHVIEKDYNYDWLLPLEILEINVEEDLNLLIRQYLDGIKVSKPEYKILIEEGIKLIENEYNNNRSK